MDIAEYVKKSGIGALITGALATLLTGNPWIGLAAGLAALFWPAIANQLGLTEQQGQAVLGAAIGALLGAVLAKLFKVGLGTSIVWTGIGALLFAGLWPAIQEYLDSGDWEKSIQSINFALFGAGLGALIGNAVNGPLGAALGGVIGLAIGAGIQGGIDAWASGENGWQIADAANWTVIGTGIGAAIGSFITPGIGTAIGAVIGGLVGLIGDKIAEVLAAIDGDWDIAAQAFHIQ